MASSPTLCLSSYPLRQALYNWANDRRLDEQKNSSKVLCYVFLLFFAWLFVGAYVFDALQDRWGAAEAAYFCIVTLTTIGFGDFTPTTDASRCVDGGGALRESRGEVVGE